MPGSQKMCETCRDYKPGTGGLGHCHAAPNAGTAYPTDWCSYHVLRIAKSAPQK